VTLVIDSSAVVAALTDGGDDGEWARAAVRGHALVAPSHLFVEASNVLRRLVLAGGLTGDLGALAHEDLMQLSVTAVGFEVLARRVWALHPNLTAYDAAYVALAEELGAPLLTLDARLARAPGTACSFLLPQLPEG
jgi:predicted nucleic acid-binding protein